MGYVVHNHMTLDMVLNIDMAHKTPLDIIDIDMACGDIIDTLVVNILHSNYEMLQTNDIEIAISVIHSTGSYEM